MRSHYDEFVKLLFSELSSSNATCSNPSKEFRELFQEFQQKKKKESPTEHLSVEDVRSFLVDVDIHLLMAAMNLMESSEDFLEPQLSVAPSVPKQEEHEAEKSKEVVKDESEEEDEVDDDEEEGQKKQKNMKKPSKRKGIQKKKTPVNAFAALALDDA